MHTAIAGSVGVVAYLALFAGIGILFVFINLLIGHFVRPADPHAEKLEIYECGEPAIGSSFVQFDLRFYVVALIFIIFDVEVAFLFPWATVFGKADHLVELADARMAVVQTGDAGTAGLTPHAEALYRELGVAHPTVTDGADASAAISDGSRLLFALTIVEGLVFFVILLVAFAYEWKIGALDWVRAVTAQTSARPDSLDADVNLAEPVLSA